MNSIYAFEAGCWIDMSKIVMMQLASRVDETTLYELHIHLEGQVEPYVKFLCKRDVGNREANSDLRDRAWALAEAYVNKWMAFKQDKETSRETLTEERRPLAV